MLKQFNLIKNTTTPWLCFKAPESPLFYFLHSKCASTFYRQLLVRLGWKYCTTSDINWETDIVFSHIRDPLKKHRIGIIEWFYHNNKEALLTQNSKDSDFMLMLSKIAYLDHHSLSIYEHLGERSQHIIWIPIDVIEIDHKQLTIELLQQHVKIDTETQDWFKNLPMNNESTGIKKQLFQELMQLPIDPLITNSIEYDRCLYDNVTKTNYEPENYARRIGYLKSLGMSQEQAEQHADRDVETGEYLNWN